MLAHKSEAVSVVTVSVYVVCTCNVCMTLCNVHVIITFFVWHMHLIMHNVIMFKFSVTKSLTLLIHSLSLTV